MPRSTGEARGGGSELVCISRVEGRGKAVPRSYTQYARGHCDEAEACESLPDSPSVSSPAGVTTAGGAPAKRGPPEKRGDPPRGDTPRDPPDNRGPAELEACEKECLPCPASGVGATSGSSAVACSSSGSAGISELPDLLDRDLRSSSAAICRSHQAALSFAATTPLSPCSAADPRWLVCMASASRVSAPPTHALIMLWRTAPISRASRHMLTARCWPVKKATAMRA
eukprot:scaffold61249_cov64-Phaeocystis_antarctica.AAC.4